MLRIILFCLLIIGTYICKSQESNNLIRDMKYFNEDYFKDWKADLSFVATVNSSYLKKGIERVEIEKGGKEILLRFSNTQDPYEYFYTYDPIKKVQLMKGFLFCSMAIGSWEYFDTNGELIKKKDMNEGFTFSLDDLIKKMKQDYQIDLCDKTNNISIIRGYFDGHQCYQIVIPTSFEDEYKVYKIDGFTGEVLLAPNFKRKKEKKKSTSSKNTTFQGKTYTEEEWKAFEQEQWEKYQAKRSKKGFWDILFG